MEVLSGHLKNIRVPCGNDNVYKDECVYSYDTPVCGLLSLNFLVISIELHE